jgi:hypothetical protein
MSRSGTVTCLLFAACALVAASGLYAASKVPPYDAVVESDEAFVRCGPGKDYYPTEKLKRGDHVTVRRHDPGGWFMIDPLPGSFSLVRSDDVQREGNVGTVKPLADGQSAVRIGSSIDATNASVYQRQLSSGERVEILGEATVAHRGSTMQMLKVRSPKGEFRWVEGMSLIPVDQQAQEQQIRDQQTRRQPSKVQADADPFATPPQSPKAANASLVRSTVPRNQTVTLSPRQVAKPAPPATQSQLTVVPKAAVTDPQSRLDQIDHEFRDIVQRHPTTWNLVQLEQAYRDLSQQPTVTAEVRGQLELRFSSIEHYRQIKGQYDDYFRLVSNTAHKDAELAAIQNSADPQDARPPILPVAQIPVAAEPAVSAPQATTAPTGPALIAPNPQTPPPQEVPEFNSTSRQPANPQPTARPAGPVLENPVPLPTEPEPQATPRETIHRELVVPTPPASTPSETSNPAPDVELRLQPAPAAPSPNRGSNLRSRPILANDMPQQPMAPVGPPPMQNPNVVPQGPPPTVVPTPVPTMAAPVPVPVAVPQVRQAPAANPGVLPPLAAPRQIHPQAPGALDGAGIVQRAVTPVPGGPQHVLLAPNGRILAYLYPDRGVNLDAYVGHPMGIVGPRAYRPELQADLIVVRGMVPVRLAP